MSLSGLPSRQALHGQSRSGRSGRPVHRLPCACVHPVRQHSRTHRSVSTGLVGGHRHHQNRLHRAVKPIADRFCGVSQRTVTVLVLHTVLFTTAPEDQLLADRQSTEYIALTIHRPSSGVRPWRQRNQELHHDHDQPVS